MAGYSGTPLAKKLGIKEGTAVLARHAPPRFWESLQPVPTGAHEVEAADGDHSVDVLVYFTTERAALEKDFPGLADTVAWDGGLWIAWPKKAAKIPADVTENDARDVALAHGLVDNKVCAIDETWSGLRIVHRVANRPR